MCDLKYVISCWYAFASLLSQQMGVGGVGGALGASSALDKRTSPARTEACSAPPSELLRDYEGVSVSGCRVRARNTFDTTLRADLRHLMWIYTCCPTNNSFSLWTYVSLTMKSTVLKKKKHISLQQPMMKLGSAFLHHLLADGVKNSPQ